MLLPCNVACVTMEVTEILPPSGKIYPGKCIQVNFPQEDVISLGAGAPLHPRQLLQDVRLGPDLFVPAGPERRDKKPGWPCSLSHLGLCSRFLPGPFPRPRSSVSQEGVLEVEQMLIYSFPTQAGSDPHAFIFLPSPPEVAPHAMVAPPQRLCRVFSEAPGQAIYYHCRLATQTDVISSAGFLQHPLPDCTVMSSRVASHHRVRRTGAAPLPA